MSFLLDVTDPASKSSTGVFASQDPDADLVPPSNTHPSCWENDLVRSEDSQTTPVDLNSLFWGFDNPFLGDLPFDSWVTGQPLDIPFAFSGDPNGDLQIRLNALASEMRRLEKDVCSRYGNIQLTRPTETDYGNLFTAASFLELVSAFFQRTHWQWPILHRPTFDLHKACLPLLLSIILSGAAYSRPDDKTAEYSASAEAFHSIAEAYIFDHLDSVVTASSNTRDLPSNGAIEACQAALVVEIVLISMNNREMRRRMLTKNHPSLVAAIRTMALASIQQQQQQPHAHSVDMPSWDSFIRHESLVRVATWVFLQDSVLTVFCNQPPSMAISEMVGGLPCDEELWAVGSEAEFEAKRQQIKRLEDWQPHSIRHLVTWLLNDDIWKGQQTLADRGSRCNLSLGHLHMLIWGIFSRFVLLSEFMLLELNS